jgi:hypothetical protein
LTLRAFHCTACGAQIWRFTTHGRDGTEVPLYPLPSARFARLLRNAQIVPGVGYCARHAPAIESAGPVLMGLPTTVVALEPAGVRYAAWFTDEFGEELAARLMDTLELPEHEWSAVVAQWELDKAVAEVACG